MHYFVLTKTSPIAKTEIKNSAFGAGFKISKQLVHICPKRIYNFSFPAVFVSIIRQVYYSAVPIGSRGKEILPREAKGRNYAGQLTVIKL